MQFYYKVNDSHMRMITAVGYNPFRHVIVTGSEDGVVKFWEVDTGNLVANVRGHKGWVKGFVFWKGARILLSGSLDATVCLWRGEIQISTVYMGDPVQSMCIIGSNCDLDDRNTALIVATSTGILVEPLIETTGSNTGGFVDVAHEERLDNHLDLVSNVVSCDNKIASVGFDLRLVLYEYLLRGGVGVVNPSFVVKGAHVAAITCLTSFKDLEDNIWFITGGYDKCVKVWSSGGKLVTRVNELGYSIFDLCVVDRTGLIWVSTGENMPWIIDAKSGENMTSFASSFRNIKIDNSRIQMVRYLAEVGMVIATTTRRHILTWRYHSNSAVTRLICGIPVDCITYTKRSPIMLMCSVGSGQIILWENSETNDGAYKKDLNNLFLSMKRCVEDKLQTRQFQMDPNYSKIRKEQKEEARKNKKGQRFLKVVYIDDKDYLIAASEDGNIYVIGYDVAAIEALMEAAHLRPPESKWKKTRFKLALPTVKTPGDLTENMSDLSDVDPVTMRITGLSCQHVLIDHRNVVTGLAVVPPGHGRTGYFLITCSWDQHIIVWSLDNFELMTRFSDKEKHNSEIAADDVITQLAYSESEDHFVYSSGDYNLHIRKFSLIGSKMELIGRIDDHDGELTCIIWVQPLHSWITASEDHTIRIWNSKDDLKCSQIINAGSSVSSICYEEHNKCIIAAVGLEIKIFDIIEERMVQLYLGHVGEIRQLILVPEKSQFVSVSEDGQVLMWNNWVRPRKYVAPDL